jgi:DNA-binding transcriptional ArsR family regulator
MAIEQLNPVVWEILDGKGTGRDPFGNAMQVAFRCMDAELTQEDYLELIKDTELAHSLRGKKDGKSSTQWLGSAVKAWEFADQKWQPPVWQAEKYLNDIDELRQQVAAFTFPGRAKATDKHTALALIDWADELGYPGVRASTRSLALKTGVSHVATSKSLQRLAKLGLIDIRKATQQGTPDELYVNLGWKPQGEKLTTKSRGGNRSDVNFSSQGLHEVFFRGAGLGPSASVVFTALSAHQADDWLTVNQLVEATGLTAQTIRANLRKMVGPGLVEAREQKRPAVYRQHPEADLDQAAKAVGADGEREYRSNQILIDRAQWANYLAVKAGQAKAEDLFSAEAVQV